MLSHTSSESLAFHIGFPVVWMDWQTNGHVIIKISRMDRLPNFIGMNGALLACTICTHRAPLLVERWKVLSKIWRIMQIWMNEWMNEWMNGKAYQNMHWKLLEKPDISRVLPLLNHWGRGSTLEMSSFSNLFNAYNVFWWTLPFTTIIYFNRGIIEWVWDSFIDGMLSPRTQWSKFVDGLIAEFFKQSYK